MKLGNVEFRSAKPNKSGVYRVNYQGRIWLGKVKEQLEDDALLILTNSAKEQTEQFASECLIFNHF